MIYITPQVLRDAALLLASDGTGEDGNVFMCNAVRTVTRLDAAVDEFFELLKDLGYINESSSCLSWSDLYGYWDYSCFLKRDQRRQEIRFMLFEFLALSLED